MTNPLAQLVRAVIQEMQTHRRGTRTLGARPQDLVRWEQRLEDVALAIEQTLGQQSDSTLSMASGVSHRTGQGFVTLTWGAQRGQLDVTDARQHALRLLEAAEAAEYDAIFVQWLRDNHLVDTHDAAARLLVSFRQYREHGAVGSAGHDVPLQQEAPPDA